MHKRRLDRLLGPDEPPPKHPNQMSFALCSK
jgi:hypothetical protein